MKQRANDTDYPFRAHSAFAHLTGWGSDSEPGAVLVFEPAGGDGHAATVYFRERAGRDSEEFYANPAIGEFWIGARPSLAHVAADLGVATRGIDELDRVIDAVDTATLVLREADAAVTERVDHARIRFAAEQALSTNAAGRAVLDRGRRRARARRRARTRALRAAPREGRVRGRRDASRVDATQRGFTEVLEELPRITSEVRGERVIEGVFATRARLEGNDVGYDSIAAAGPHATILHWTRNDGPVVPGDLVLLDAGVELDTLLHRRHHPHVPGERHASRAVQRQVYEAVLEAADAAFAVVKPGAIFREVHAAAMQVIARKTAEWGFLPVSAEESLAAREPVPPPLHGARHEPPPGPRRARLRPGAPRHLHGRRARGRAWSSRSSRACTSSPTTSPCPRSSAASACASRTTSSSPRMAPRTSRRHPPHGRRGRGLGARRA